MTDTVNVYHIYYGDWNNTAAVENIDHFVSNLGATNW